MTKKRNIGGVIALIIGLSLFIGAGVLLTLHLRKNSISEDDDSTINSGGSATPQKTQTNAETAITKRMQQLLLTLGINYNNHLIIDAIRLTGGIDGIKGDGFNAALQEAIDKGYIESYEDLRSRVS